MYAAPKSILTDWEVEHYVQNLKTTDLENVGTKEWFESHKKLILLNEQSFLEISSQCTENVKDCFITFNKIPVLIHEAIQMMIWKGKVYPLLVELYGEPTNTFLLFSVFYHEETVISILENILFHADSVDNTGDSIIDLIDYAVNYVTMLLYSKKPEMPNSGECLSELTEKKFEIQFDIGMRCISILRYLAEFADNLPLYALSRMLTTNDVPYLFAQLIELSPWKKISDKGETMIYNGKWEKLEESNRDKLCKFEAQAWFGLRELLLNPKCSRYYNITELRVSQLSKLQKYLQEAVLDQAAPLIELRKWLSCLNISSQTSDFHQPLNIEVLPEISHKIMEKYNKRWQRLAEHQAKTLFSKDIEHIKNMAQILSEAYDFDKLDIIDSKKCYLCKNIAKHRCSVCKEAWYCGRKCQVQDWLNHKTLCQHIFKSKSESNTNTETE